MAARTRLAELLRLRDFRRLLAVRVLSQLSDGVFQAALASYVVFSPEREANAASIAAVLAVTLLPFSFVGPFTGVLLDRLRRRQVLLYGNLARCVLGLLTAGLVVARVPDAVFFCAALLVTAVNRFILAGLSAALPRVVDRPLLITANSLSPTLGTVAATAGAGAGVIVRLLLPPGVTADAALVALAAGLYLGAALAARTMGRDLLGPEHRPDRSLREALGGTARGLADGLRRLVHDSRPALHALTAVTAMRFCYGLLTVLVLVLARSAADGSGSGRTGLATLGTAVAASGAGFLLAAVLTPPAARRLGTATWLAACSGAAAIFVPALGLSFATLPLLAAALLLGLVTQGAKICADTIVQRAVPDGYRGRVFAVYDVLYNVAFVAAAAVAAATLPPSGRSAAVVAGAGALYAVTAGLYARTAHRTPPAGT